MFLFFFFFFFFFFFLQGKHGSEGGALGQQFWLILARGRRPRAGGDVLHGTHDGRRDGLALPRAATAHQRLDLPNGSELEAAALFPALLLIPLPLLLPLEALHLRLHTALLLLPNALPLSLRPLPFLLPRLGVLLAPPPQLLALAPKLLIVIGEVLLKQCSATFGLLDALRDHLLQRAEVRTVHVRRQRIFLAASAR
eukprot:NODE_3818_length_740_cov_183.046715.p2 GENE.NODE_3818_length_740_cov_183.046715~~NODE_3818_length_740_cov_183.046715.p2  ORF type:complete len:207 (+),score=101.72 NODE_3818_length_740_cov_183.046715:31-621(+)